MGIKMIAAAAALSLTGSLLAASPALSNEPTANTKAAAKDPAKRVCKSVIPSGSRLSVRTCRTQADWDAEAEKAQRGAMEYGAAHAGDVHPTRGRPGQ